MTNDQLLAAWKRKLPNVEPTDQELTAFALGVEVGQVELATQVALVEKCMVAMNENADKGEKAEAELARLKAQPAAWTVLLQQSQANFQKNFGGNVAANWVYNDLRELFADAAPVQPALTDERIREIYCACTDAGDWHRPEANFRAGFHAALRTGGAG